MVEKLVSEDEWNDALAGLPAFAPPSGPVLFLAPHPDDESLAAGGLLACLAEKGTPVMVVAVTDGGAAYDPSGDSQLANLRIEEQVSALAKLGVSERHIVRLRIHDSCVRDHVPQLTKSSYQSSKRQLLLRL